MGKYGKSFHSSHAIFPDYFSGSATFQILRAEALLRQPDVDSTTTTVSYAHLPPQVAMTISFSIVILFPTIWPDTAHDNHPSLTSGSL